ncbi:MAG: amidohydrolase family protein [Acidimicrobiia bacterium]|nr:amidohydrolase family protein [Acidimicrobiia bacterium]
MVAWVTATVPGMAKADLAIRDVVIHDGSGGPPAEGDVEVRDGRISSVGSAGAASVDLDGAGRVLCPGFVDVHTHDDGALVRDPGLGFKVAQGVTSVVIGNCGFSAVPVVPGEATGGALDFRGGWGDLAGYGATVEGGGPAVNFISQVGHNTLRQAAMGLEKRPPTSAELATMRGWVFEAMEQGAVGLSTGLMYQPGRWAATEEIVELARAAASHDGLYNTHLRNEGDRLLEAVDEALLIGRESGCPVHLSHHKAAGQANWGKVVDSLAKVDEANGTGADVTLDVYPYVAGSGPMYQYFDLERVDVGLAEVIRIASCLAFPELEGRMLTDVAAERDVGLAAVVREVLTHPLGKQTICIQFLMREEDVETNLGHPLVMVGSDGIPDVRGQPHPRLFGTFPRVLGHYVRDREVLPLGEAVRRMTSLSCDRFGLAGRGRVAEGDWADLVVFDPRMVRDLATWDDPRLEPAGVALVLVNGQVAYRDGEHTGVGAGRALRFRELGPQG